MRCKVTSNFRFSGDAAGPGDLRRELNAANSLIEAMGGGKERVALKGRALP